MKASLKRSTTLRYLRPRPFLCRRDADLRQRSVPFAGDPGQRAVAHVVRAPHSLVDNVHRCVHDELVQMAAVLLLLARSNAVNVRFVSPSVCKDRA